MKRKTKGLRIAMIGHKRVPSREGGVEVVVEELSRRMVEKGHIVTCYNRRGQCVSGVKNTSQPLDEYCGIRLKYVPTVDKKGLAAVTSSFFAAVCAAFGSYDVVHFHAEGPCAMLWIPKLFGKRCVATIHGLDHQRAKWGRFASFYIRFGEKCAARLADELIVLSDSVRRYFLEAYHRDAVFIPNGVSVPSSADANEISERFALSKDGYVLYLGRLVPEKGIHYLIEAYKGISTDKKLVIAGGSSDAIEYENVLRSMANDDQRIVFTGFVQGRLLSELYSNAYLYVLPSDIEGMPLSLLEAMSFGNCCLTSDIPECTEVCERCGYSFRKGDVDDLKSILCDLLNDPRSVNVVKERAAGFVTEKYSWDDVVDRTLALY